jgi:hypothetical protein
MIAIANKESLVSRTVKEPYTLGTRKSFSWVDSKVAKTKSVVFVVTRHALYVC